MKSNDKKKKELKKVKSETSTGKGQSDYQLEKTRKTIIETAPSKAKK